MAGRRLVVVSVGTDHHRFDRLMAWVESWTAAAPGDVDVVVQHGASRAPAGTRSYELLPKDELVALMARADVLLLQGGPGGIMDARRLGRLPIVVPRLGRLHEVVDDHQVTFCRQLALTGDIVLAESQTALHAALDRALADPAGTYRAFAAEHVDDTVQRLSSMLDGLLASSAAGSSRHRIGSILMRNRLHARTTVGRHGKP